MLQVHTLKTLDETPQLRDQMFHDRKRQFVDRLNWSVSHDDDGREIDEYDNEQASYILQRDREGNHLGSIRLSEIERNFMIGDHFRDDFPNFSELPTRTWEVTRLCICPELQTSKKRDISRQIFRGLSHFALAEQAVEFVGLCYAPLVRIYRNAGCRPDTLTRGKVDPSLLMARWGVCSTKLQQMYPPQRMTKRIRPV